MLIKMNEFHVCTGKVLLWNSRACHRELPEIPKDLVQLKVVVHQFVLEVSEIMVLEISEIMVDFTVLVIASPYQHRSCYAFKP